MTINLATRQSLFVVLCCAHLIGASIAVIAATYEIKSIIPSGIFFGPLGLGTSVLIRWGAPRSLALLGLSVSSFSLAVFALINIQGWGPYEAALPVSIILLVYETLALPLSLLALRDVLCPRAGHPFGMNHQFSLRTLLLVMAAASLVLAAIKSALNSGAPVLLAIAVGHYVATLLGITATWLSAVGGPNFSPPENVKQVGASVEQSG